MVALPQVKQVADLPDSKGVILIPAGQYKAVILKSEMVDNKAKTGSFLALSVEITDGPHRGTEFTERLNLVNNNPQAVDIAYKTLARISEAFGMTQTPADSSELHNKPLMIEVKNPKSKDWVNNDGETVEGKEQSEIKKYLKIPASGVPTPTETAPTEEIKPATATAPSTNPFAAT